MGLSIEIQKKPKAENIRQICKPDEVFKLEEVQEIKDAVQEHLLFIGLNNKNYVNNVSLIGIGTSKSINVDSKYIIRTALVTASDKVILVHNHPSNTLIPSREDKHITNVTNRLLNSFNIEFLDHIIVSSDGYISMGEIKEIDRDYDKDSIESLFILEENKKLKNEIQNLTKKLEGKEKTKQVEEEFE